ncbi:UNVERIFIED_CONTAM: hypothetical protein GTU68_031328 [Idotea baltica]|nr:hypothetical protein [Idotea baltica]MCL4129818.1 hypothetical protein [Idotea baltica]
MLIDQIEANLDDALANGGFIDILPFLPSTFSGEVCTDLINLALKYREASVKAAGCSKTSSSCLVFCESIVVSEKLVTKVSVRLEQLMPSKAQEAIAKGAFKQQLSSGRSKAEDEASRNKKDERRKKATGGKSGGGTQGRETKTKSTKNKNKGRRGASHFSDDEDEANEASQKSNKMSEIEFLSEEEMKKEIEKEPELEDCPEELLDALVEHLFETMTRKFQNVAKAAFMATMSAGGDTRKKTHQQLQEKILALLSTIQLAKKGMNEFGDEIRTQLCKYLLRTHCSEIVNEVVQYLADDSQIDLKSNKELSPEVRLKIINQLDDDLKQPLLAVHKKLTGSSVEEFLTKIDDAIAAADIIHKKKDNKKDRQVLLNHRSGLVDQLNVSLNAALSLHLSCLILFQAATGNLLHASGKFVPQILAFLKPHVQADFYDVLHEYQVLVMKSLTLKENESASAINTRLEELTPRLKEMTITFKKASKERENSVSED